MWDERLPSVTKSLTPQALHRHQPWLHSPVVDSLFILGPALLSIGVVLAFPRLQKFRFTAAWWLVLVVGVDVAHVYASAFRLLLDQKTRDCLRSPIASITLISWLVGALLYSLKPRFFWTALAYLAVFHFVRQAYGFFRLYERNEAGSNDGGDFRRYWQTATIYGATLYPLIYWHTHLPRDFNWFMDGDFAVLPWGWLSWWSGVVYLLLLIVYCAVEFTHWRRQKWINWPRNLWLVGTAGTWYIGIVYCNTDFIFTLCNVLGHGIPYMALVAIYGGRARKQPHRIRPSWVTGVFRWQMLPFYIAILFLLAYLEEGLWDGWVWREHGSVFAFFQLLSSVHQPFWLSILVPFLALPQATHYVLDALLWRRGNQGHPWPQILFGSAKELNKKCSPLDAA